MATFTVGAGFSSIIMMRLKTKHSYHDADIASVTIEDNACVIFAVKLCGCSDLPGAMVHLAFHRVRNIDVLREIIDGVVATSLQEKGRLPELLGLTRDAERRFVLHLDSGSLRLDAGGFTET